MKKSYQFWSDYRLGQQLFKEEIGTSWVNLKGQGRELVVAVLTFIALFFVLPYALALSVLHALMLLLCILCKPLIISFGAYLRQRARLKKRIETVVNMYRSAPDTATMFELNPYSGIGKYYRIFDMPPSGKYKDLLFSKRRVLQQWDATYQVWVIPAYTGIVQDFEDFFNNPEL